jgi:hypothetical protein
MKTTTIAWLCVTVCLLGTAIGRSQPQPTPPPKKTIFDDDEKTAKPTTDHASATAPKPLPKPQRATRTVVADRLQLVADDFVVDVYVNGKLLPAECRKLQGDVYGAQVERVDVELHEGDSVVFNVANNQLRWKGARYFACAGLLGDETHVAFVSETRSGRWLACDDLAQIARFVAEPDFGSDTKAQAIANPWNQGDKRMHERVPTWNGEAVWGSGHSTWIKYVVKAAD